MNLDEAIANRRSVRSFSARPVNQEDLWAVLEAARKAPSATNRQPWRLIPVSDSETKEVMSRSITQNFVTQAPVVIVCGLDRKAFTREMVAPRIEELVEVGVIQREVADLLYVRKMPEKWQEAAIPPSAYLEMGAAIEHMALKAASMGLGTCWIRMFEGEKLHKSLELPEEIEITALLPLGYPQTLPPARPRLPMESIIVDNNWRE